MEIHNGFSTKNVRPPIRLFHLTRLTRFPVGKLTISARNQHSTVVRSYRMVVYIFYELYLYKLFSILFLFFVNIMLCDFKQLQLKT